MGFMNGNLDSDDDDDDDRPAVGHNNKHTVLNAATNSNQSSVPLAAPRPGYAAPIAALHIPSPSPAQTPDSRQQRDMQMPQPKTRPTQVPAALLPAALRSGPGPAGEGLQISMPIATPRGPPIFPQRQPSSPSPTVPSTPHPLDAPMTPIQPAFLRPAKSRDIKFEKEAIMRGNSEDHLLPKRGEKGDEFWRRFSMVAKDDAMANHKPSSWLAKTEDGTNRLSRWVWVVGIILLLVSFRTTSYQLQHSTDMIGFSVHWRRSRFRMVYDSQPTQQSTTQSHWW